MIEIWTEFSRFKATNQRLTDQFRTITKNGWFSDREIQKIPQQIYRQTHQQTPTTVTETIKTGKPETPNQTLHDNESCTANTQMRTLTYEEKTYIDTVTRIMSEKKTNCLLSGTKTGEQSSSKPRKWTTYWQISQQTISRSQMILCMQEQN